MIRNMTYQFNENGQLTQITNRSSGATQNPIVAAYRYAPDGKRIAKYRNGVLTQQWAWGLWETPVLEMDGSGTIKAVTIMLPNGEKVGELRNTANAWTTEYWMNDVFGNLTVRGDANGQILQKELKLPFGEGYFDGAVISKRALRPELQRGRITLAQPWIGGGSEGSADGVYIAPNLELPNETNR